MKKYVAFLALGVLAFASTPAQAAPITWELDKMFAGTVMPGILVINLETTATDTVRLTVDATGLKTGEFLNGDGLFLNLDPSFTSITITDVPNVPPNYIPTIKTYAQDAYKADGDGAFDINITFDQNGAGRLNAGETATFDISGSGLVPQSFLFTSAPTGGSDGGLYVAAHVQGIAIPTGTTSAWMTKNGTVPEASTLMLFGSGLSGLLFFVRKKGLIRF